MSNANASDHAGHGEMIDTVAPPTTVGGILRRLGPGLIIAASIVGSGELIGTTKTGADAGYTLLWLIVIGCVIKVFVQVEFGRHAIAEGVTTIEALNRVPGPRWRVGWLVWAWLAMFIASCFGQLGGILGGVGQLLATKFPITGDFLARLDDIETHRNNYTYDDVYYSAAVAIFTSVLLVYGRYRIVQNIATVLVAGFTAVTVFNVMALPYFSDPTQDRKADVGWNYIWQGLSFQLPDKAGALATALATFGIIGVGASELIAYPYWCVECGYARFTGKRDSSAAWADRARGWMRVMRWDAWFSMVVYTFATIAFYVLGAAVLHARNITPDDDRMVRKLATMYEDVFHPWGDEMFLLGAFAVLYSTLFVAAAGNARIAADALRVYGLTASDELTRRRWVKILCGTIPIANLAVFAWSKKPVHLVLVSGLAQAMLLPLLGVAALYYRFRHCDPRIAPGKWWDAFLWISVAGLAVAGFWGAYSKILELVQKSFVAA